MQLEHLPFTCEELIEYLDKIYPDKCPDPAETDRNIWIHVGSRRVVNHLLELLRRTKEDSNILNVRT